MAIEKELAWCCACCGLAVTAAQALPGTVCFKEMVEGQHF
jgi:hypothetical protein